MREKYIAVEYDAATQQNLRAWAQNQGFKLDVDFNGDPQSPLDFDFHTTIFFSNSKHILTNGTWHTKPSLSTATGFDLLGPDRDIPVLRVEGQQLSWLRNHYEKKYGMTDEWGDYKAHISLSYHRNPEYKAPELPTFPLLFDRLVIKDAIRKG